MNQLKAIFVSFVITGLIAGAMVIIGGSALFAPSNPVNAASLNTSGALDLSADAPADVQRLEDLVNQYQAREQQLRSQLDDLNKQLDEKDQQLAQSNAQVDQATQQIGQYQNLLQALAERGVIQITSDGRIRIASRAAGGNGSE